MLQFFAQQYLGFDVASAGEIQSLRALGVPGKDMALCSPIKDVSSLQSLFTEQISTFTFDTIAELDRIMATKKALGIEISPSALVRMRVESTNVDVDLNAKFGCDEAEAPALLAQAQQAGFQAQGIAFHVGTQCYEVENYVRALQQAQRVAQQVQERFGITVPVIDIGGGFCDLETAYKAGIDLDSFFRELAQACQAALAQGYQLCAQPGRFLVSSAGYLVTQVIGEAMRGGKRWLYLDDGIYGALSCRTYEKTRYTFHPLRALTGKPIPTVLAGPTCDSLDIVDTDALQPEDLTIGDLLLTPSVGAYSLSTATTFNGFAPPPCFLVEAPL